MLEEKPFKEIAIKILADALNAEKCESFVLNGLDFSTGNVGRDLDLYVPEGTSRRKILSIYYYILYKIGADWVVIMPPIWGDRCIGIWKERYQYTELHLIPTVRMGPISAEYATSRTYIEATSGFRYDPWLYIFKSVLMKRKNEILTKKPLWGTAQPDDFTRACFDSCLDLASTLHADRDFLKSLIDTDNEQAYDRRREGLKRFLFKWCTSHPFTSGLNLILFFTRKFNLYLSPCVPWFEIESSEPLSRINDELTKRLTGIFVKVIITNHRINFLERRRMQAMQHLLVFYRAGDAVDFQLKTAGRRRLIFRTRSIDELAHRILHETAQFNRTRGLLSKNVFSVAVLGPDGAGKSTLLGSLCSVPVLRTRHQYVFHLYPPIKSRNIPPARVTNPHAKPNWGIFASVLKLFLLVGRYNTGWMLTKWKCKLQSSSIYFDRYYHDMLADPRRYRMGAPAWLVRLFGHLIPKPDLFLILDVQPEVARARKTEVSEAESQRQFHAYRALAEELPNAVLIDANGSPEDVASACERAVVEAMAYRLGQRMGWSRTEVGSS